MSSGDQTTNHRRKGHEPRLRTSYRSTMGRSTRCPKRRRPSLSGPNATGGRQAGRPTAAVAARGGSSRAPRKSSSACRSSAGRARGRCATGSPRHLPTRNSRRNTSAGSGRTTESSASTARSGGERGSSGPFRTTTHPSDWRRRG